MKSILSTFLLLCLALATQAQAPNNTLRGKVLYQSSGNKPAVGVRIAEPDANPTFSVDNGDYVLKFQNKRNGEALALEIGKDDGKSQKLELVNEKEVKAAKLPASTEEILEIIVCPAGQRDIAAQKYYRILRTTADRELEKKKKEVEGLLAQKEKDYQKISDLFAQLNGMQVALDSAKIKEQALNIASINLDRASQMVKDAVKKIEEENDVEGALRILSVEALDTAYQLASASKRQAEAIIRKADAGIQQVVEGYKFKISLLEPKFKYGEVAQIYEKIAEIYEREKYDIAEMVVSLDNAATYWGLNGDAERSFKIDQKALSIQKKYLPANHPFLPTLYSNLATTCGDLGDYQKKLGFILKALTIQKKSLPEDHPDLAQSYGKLAVTYDYLGKYQEALKFHLKCMETQEKVLPSDNQDLAMTYSNIGQTYNHMGESQKALNFDLKALQIREKILPENHPELALSYSNISVTYYNLAEYSNALEFSLKASAIQEKVLPPNHPDLAMSYINIAASYGSIGNFNKQLDFNQKALSIQEKVLPANHPNLAKVYNNIAYTYVDLGEYQKSLEFDLKSLSIREKVLPAGHPDLAQSYNNIGLTYAHLLQFPQAKECFEKFQKTDNSGRAFRNWAVYYALQNDRTHAIENLKKAIALGFNNLKWIETDESLESIHGEQGYKEIVEQLKKQ